MAKKRGSSKASTGSLSPSVKKSTKVVKQQKKKLQDLDETELIKLLGSLRGDKDKLLDEIKKNLLIVFTSE